MKCPHCGSTKRHRVKDTRSTAQGHEQRYRVCANCKTVFTTIESVAVYAGRSLGWIVDQPEPEKELPSEVVITQASPPRPTKPVLFHPAIVGSELLTADKRVAANLIEWWDNSRWSRHGKKATWTQQSWLLNVNRVLKMSPNRAIAVSEAGVENGWLALKDYGEDQKPEPSNRLTPKSAAMQSAIDQMSWK